eukprot:SAG22_NODE_536_length_9364_cov_15.973988_6_plen_224_part_00
MDTILARYEDLLQKYPTLKGAAATQAAVGSSPPGGSSSTSPGRTTNFDLADAGRWDEGGGGIGGGEAGPAPGPRLRPKPVNQGRRLSAELAAGATAEPVMQVGAAEGLPPPNLPRRPPPLSVLTGSPMAPPSPAADRARDSSSSGSPGNSAVEGVAGSELSPTGLAAADSVDGNGAGDDDAAAAVPEGATNEELMQRAESLERALEVANRRRRAAEADKLALR